MVVEKFQTRNKLYLYVQSERERSYNFYGDYQTDDIIFALKLPEPANYVYRQYGTNGWPIIIEEFHQPSAGAFDSVKITLRAVMAAGIGRNYWQLSTLFISSYWTNDGLLETPSFFAQFKNYTDTASTLNSVSNMMMIFYTGHSPNPPIPYHENLFGPVNLKNVFALPTPITSEFSYSVAYNKFRPLTFNRINKIKQTYTHTKVICDEQTISTPTPSTKRRRLYVSSIQDFINKSENIPTLNLSVYNKKQQFYYANFYNDINFSTYKGEINDSSAIGSLTLVNSVDFKLKQYFFNLGLLEEEYNQLLYNSTTVPTPLPATPFIPVDATNIYFHLEDVTSISANKDFRKFKLGLKFENSAGTLEIKYPATTANEVYVYTIDGFYFFTKKFSDYQQDAKAFSNSSAHFRPVSDSNWPGYFGFDWLRINDTNLSGDNSSSVYFDIVGHYYNTATPKVMVSSDPDLDASPTPVFAKEKIEWQALQHAFPSYPIKGTDYSQYVSPYLTLYPSLDRAGNASGFPKTSNGSQKCLTECELNLETEIKSTSIPSGLRIRFEKLYMEVTSVTAADTSPIADPVDPSKYSCLEITDKTSGSNTIKLKIKALREFIDDKKITVIATENAVERIAGELIVKGNDKSLRKETKLAFVNVHTNFNGTGSGEDGIDFTTTIDEDLEKSINQIFNQGLIDIKTVLKLQIDQTPATSSTFNVRYKDSSGNFRFENSSNSSYVIHDDLRQAVINLDPTNPNKYDDFMFIFYIGLDDSTTRPDGSISYINGAGLLNTGLTIIMKNGVGTPGHPNDTTSHELMHATGLYHSFSSLNDYTFKKFITDNIMDYQNSSSPSRRFTILPFQKEIIKKNKFIVNEK